MINETGRLILSYLLAQKEPISSKKLADLCDLSLSTIRKEILVLNEEIVLHGIHVDAKQSRGCQLIIDDAAKAEKLFQELEHNLHRKIFNFKSSQYRSDYIIRRLLISSGYITMEKLCEELFYSASTIMRDINQAQNMIRRFDLTIKLKKNHGFIIEGNEFDKRICLLIQHKKFIHMDEQKRIQETRFSDYFITTSSEHFRIREKIVKIFQNFPDLEFSYINIPKISNYIILSRIRHPYTELIEITDEQLEEIRSGSIYNCAKQVFEEMEFFLGFTPSEKDICSFARLLIGYRSLSSISQIPEARREKICLQSRELLDRLIEIENIDPTVFTQETYNAFACNFYQVQSRILMKTPFDMEAFYPIRNRAALTADICCALMLEIEKRYHVTLREDYALSNLYLFDRVLTNQLSNVLAMRILILSIYGIEFTRLIAAQLWRQYAPWIKTLDTCEFITSHQINYDQYDLLITDIAPARHPQSGIQILKMDLSYWGNLSSAMDAQIHNQIQTALTKLIGSHYYITNFRKEEDVFNFIAKIHKNEITSKKAFIRDLQLRDTLISSLRQNELAFLSTCKQTLPNTVLDFFVNDRPISWNNGKAQFFIFYYHDRASRDDARMIDFILQKFLNKTASELAALLDKQQDIVDFLMHG